MIEEDQINRITERIIGAAIEVHRALGPGLLESTDHACLAHDLRQQEFEVEREKVLPVVYKGVTLDSGWSPDQFQRPAVDRGDQTIPDRKGRRSRTCVKFAP
jgi:PD-(D/E)XK nuclease superfamily